MTCQWSGNQRTWGEDFPILMAGRKSLCSVAMKGGSGNQFLYTDGPGGRGRSISRGNRYGSPYQFCVLHSKDMDCGMVGRFQLSNTRK